MRRTLVAVILTVVVVACANPDRVEGVVIDVVGDLTLVEEFTIRTNSGKTLTIVPTADGDYSFPLAHLSEHRATLAPIIVELDRSVEPPVATAIRDAENAAWHE